MSGDAWAHEAKVYRARWWFFVCVRIVFAFHWLSANWMWYWCSISSTHHCQCYWYALELRMLMKFVYWIYLATVSNKQRKKVNVRYADFPLSATSPALQQYVNRSACTLSVYLGNKLSENKWYTHTHSHIVRMGSDRMGREAYTHKQTNPFKIQIKHC